MSDAMVQVKFTIDSHIVSAFKARCASECVSMASVISQFRITCQPAKSIKVKTDTRPLRKKAVLEIIGLLDSIMQKESDYRDNIPENFQSRRETADQTFEQLSQAISCLKDALLPHGTILGDPVNRDSDLQDLLILGSKNMHRKVYGGAV